MSSYPRLPLTFALLSVCVLLAIPSASAQSPSAPPPLLVSIAMPLDISHLKPGSQVRTHVTSAWNGPGCQLALGALVQAHVSEVQKKSKADHTSAFTLVFDSAECNHGKLQPFKTTLIALLGPDTLSGPGGTGKAPPLTDLPASIGGGLRQSQEVAANYTYANRSRSLPSDWKIGMVVDTPMSLAVGKGAEGGSTISSTTTDARLEAQTTLILLAGAPPPATP